MKKVATAALSFATRTYIQRAPWSIGKRTAYRLFKSYVSWRNRSEVVRTRFGDLMELSTPDLVSATILVTGQWEPAITQHIRSRLKSGDIFVDVGANIGYYSLVASRLVGSTGKVFSIEASQRIYDRLVRNIDLNHCTNVTAVNAAASNESGELSLFSGSEINLGHSTTVASLAGKEGMGFAQKVWADTLEKLVGASHLRNARFIKVDVEGAEFPVLSPLLSSLSEFSAQTEWLIELCADYSAGGQADVDKIYDAFVSAGYTAYKIPNEYRADFMIGEAPATDLHRLDAPPTELCDVVMTRRSD